MLGMYIMVSIVDVKSTNSSVTYSIDEVNTITMNILSIRQVDIRQYIC